jgi:hypothetical protein
VFGLQGLPADPPTRGDLSLVEGDGAPHSREAASATPKPQR